MKAYVKPELFYEDFALTQNIALACAGLKGNMHDPYSCGYDTQGVGVVFSGGACDTSESEVEFVCYQTGDDSIRVFYS